MWHVHCEGILACVENCPHIWQMSLRPATARRVHTALSVQVISGSNLLSDRNTTEEKKLKKVSFLLLTACVCE